MAMSSIKVEATAIAVRTTGLDPQKDVILAVDLAQLEEEGIIEQTVYVKQDVSRKALAQVNRNHHFLQIPEIPNSYWQIAVDKDSAGRIIRNRLAGIIIIYNEKTLEFLAQVAVFPEMTRVSTFEHFSAGLKGISIQSLLLGLGFDDTIQRATRATQLLALYVHYRKGESLNGRRIISNRIN